jgi:hypothetical protein
VFEAMDVFVVFGITAGTDIGLAAVVVDVDD